MDLGLEIRRNYYDGKINSYKKQAKKCHQVF